MKNGVIYLLIFLIFVGLTVSYAGIVLADSDDDKSGSGSDDSGSNGDGDSDSKGSSNGDSNGDDDSGSGSDDSGSNGDGKSKSSSNGDSNGDGKSETETTTTEIDENGNEVKVVTKTETKNGETETKVTRTYTDENGNEVTIETKTEIKDGETETKEKQTYIDENGNEVTIETKTEIKDGESKTEEKRTITSPDGTKITFKTKTEVEDGETVTKTSVKFNGAEFDTKLSIKETFEEGEVKLTVKLSTGADQDIIVQPDEALLIAIDELRAGNISIELLEKEKKGETKAVFIAKTTQEGSFLGIFNTQIDLETLIDTETGEIIETTRPWWAFLFTGFDEETMCHIPDGDETRRTIINVLLTEVKTHLEHGDSVGACVAECEDGILVNGVEVCEVGDSQACTTSEGYEGVESCNLTCDGFDSCTSDESCGDEIVNGNEECDDGNIIDGDGCDLTCKIEVADFL